VSHAENFNYTIRQPGSKTGLRLALRVDKNSYTYANSASTGFRVSRILFISINQSIN